MIKKGTRVRIESEGDYICGGYDGRTAIVLEDCNHPHIKVDSGEVWAISDDYLTPVEPSIDNLMVGDRVISEGTIRKVLFIGNDDHIALSKHIAEDRHDVIYTKSELHDFDYIVINPSPKTTLTKKEIATKFGIEEDNMEIQ